MHSLAAGYKPHIGMKCMRDRVIRLREDITHQAGIAIGFGKTCDVFIKRAGIALTVCGRVNDNTVYIKIAAELLR